jgi:cytochrome c556
MLRTVVVMGTLLLGASAVLAQQDIAVQQQNLMKEISKSLSVVVKTVKGETPYDQAAIDAAIKGLGDNAAKIPAVFATDSKLEVPNASYASSPKIWQNKADFDEKAQAFVKTVAEFKGKIKDKDNLKVALDAIGPKCGNCHETYRVKLK